MSINPGSPIPVYQQIAADLRDAINGGVLADGDRLPSLRELRERYSSAAGTIKSALDELENEGLVIVLQGRGTFVRSPKRLRRYGSRRHILADRPGEKGPLEVEAERQGSTREQNVTDVSTSAASAEIAKRLHLDPGHSIVTRETLISVDRFPSQIATSFFPLEIASGSILERNEKVPGGVHRFLVEELGIQLNPFAVEELLARMPTPTERRTLALSAGAPIIELWRTFFDRNERPVEVTQFLLAADRNILVYEVPLE